MRLMVIGDPERRAMDEPLINNEIFEETIYAPIDQIRIETGLRTRVIYKRPVDFDSVLPIPTWEYRDLFLSVVASLHKKVYPPFGPEGILMFSKNVIAMSRLRELGFVTRDSYYAITPAAFRKTKFNFPVEVLVGTKTLTADSKKQLHDIMHLRKSGQGIIIREIIGNSTTESLVSDGKVIATVKHTKKKPKKAKLNSHMERNVAEVVKILGSSFGSVKVSENEITGVSLHPDFAMFNRTMKARVSDILLRDIKSMVMKDHTVIDTIVDKLRRLGLV